MDMNAKPPPEWETWKSLHAGEIWETIEQKIDHYRSMTKSVGAYSVDIPSRLFTKSAENSENESEQRLDLIWNLAAHENAEIKHISSFKRSEFAYTNLFEYVRINYLRIIHFTWLIEQCNVISG